MHDVYAYGVIAPSTLIELDGSFPSEAGYGEIAGVHQSLGGEAAGGAYVLARLGISTKLSGTRLSGDPESQRVIDLLSAAGVDCSAVATGAAATVTEIVFSNAAERTVFGTYGRMLADQAWSRPSHEDIVTSRIVCLDPFFGDASELAARWCRETSTPYVTVDAAVESDIARHAEVAIISEEFASRTVGPIDPHEVLAAYVEPSDGLVILTRGSGPVLYGRSGKPVRQFAPFPVEARDATGAGDSFRAGLIYGMLRGFDDVQLLEVASAVSALVCQRIPGVLDSPSEDELESFLGRTF